MSAITADHSLSPTSVTRRHCAFLTVGLLIQEPDGLTLFRIPDSCGCLGPFHRPGQLHSSECLYCSSHPCAHTALVQACHPLSPVIIYGPAKIHVFIDHAAFPQASLPVGSVRFALCPEAQHQSVARLAPSGRDIPDEKDGFRNPDMRPQVARGIIISHGAARHRPSNPADLPVPCRKQGIVRQAAVRHV